MLIVDFRQWINDDARGTKPLLALQINWLYHDRVECPQRWKKEQQPQLSKGKLLLVKRPFAERDYAPVNIQSTLFP